MSSAIKSRSHICVPATTLETVKLAGVYMHSCMLCLWVNFTRIIAELTSLSHSVCACIQDPPLLCDGSAGWG